MSYMILQRVSPVTHSIGNCLKRVIVIVASVIVFQNPMSRQNMIGAGRLACAPKHCMRSVSVRWTLSRVLRPMVHRAHLCAGTAVALAGVFAYSQVKRLSGKKKAA